MAIFICLRCKRPAHLRTAPNYKVPPEQQLCFPCEKALRDRFDRDTAEARVRGDKPSDYFLNKCGSEARPEPDDIQK